MKETMKKLKIGGMATFSGVMLKSEYKQAITSKIDKNEIEVTVNKNSKPNFISKVYILRGIYGLYASIKEGIPYIVKSAENIVKDITDEEDMKINKMEIIISFIISFIIFILAWIAIPVFTSYFMPVVEYRFVLQVAIKILAFLAYIHTLKRVTHLKELFEYHGAEHTVVNYYEDNTEEVENIKSILDVNIDKINTYSRFHKRCGSNFLMYMFYISLIVTILIPSNDLSLKTLIETLLFPIVIGLSYEMLGIFSRLPKGLDFLVIPFMYVQNITTKKPSKDKLMIATVSLLELTIDHITLEEFIKSYTDKYLTELEVNKNDILRLASLLLNRNKNDIYMNIKQINLDFNNQIKFKKLLDRYYIDFEPLQYILGVQSFYNEEYIVDKNVLIPRADSETLVETAIKYIEEKKFKKAMDLCCGTGALGISIAKNSSIEDMLLIDISDKAINVANKNIQLNDISNKCKTLESNLFTNIDKEEDKFDIIITNPPYIKSEELANLSEYVKNEPMLALNGGKTGLDIYEEIFKHANAYLKDKAYILLEIGYDQKQDLINIINEYKYYEYVTCIQDLSDKDRVIVCRFHQI